MKGICGIDPGPTETAIVVIDENLGVAFAQKMPNKDALAWVSAHRDHSLAIEMIASYGMPVGREVFETCVWIGRFIEAYGSEVRRVYRQEVKLHICKSPKANDATIRQALVDRFGGKGTKKAPGKLYGLKADLWSAFAVGLTALETQPKEQA